MDYTKIDGRHLGLQDLFRIERGDVLIHRKTNKRYIVSGVHNSDMTSFPLLLCHPFGEHVIESHNIRASIRDYYLERDLSTREDESFISSLFKE